MTPHSPATVTSSPSSSHNPPHPGSIIRKLCLEPLGLTVTDAAAALGISRKTLSSLLNGRAGISPEMAVRLSIAFGTSSESWMNQQTQYDLWHAEKRRKDLRVSGVAA
jgi:antitoxin HigA-1